MHHCLCISDVLCLVFEFILSDYFPGPRKTLASLARTCHLFSSHALDALWRDLYSLDPLLAIFPIITSESGIDDAQWARFRKYAKRVKAIHGRGTRVPVRTRQAFVASLRHYPAAYLPLLPNVTEFEWRESEFLALEDSGISLLRYFVGPSVTIVNLVLVRWLAHSPAELAVLSDLPFLCPNVTSFSVALSFSWDYEPSREIGRMVAQWPHLRSLRTCALAQPVMDQLLRQGTLELLSIDHHTASPTYVGRVPDAVRELVLNTDCPTLCTRFLGTVHACPRAFHLLIGTSEGQDDADVDDAFQMLARRLDTSRLRTLAVRPRSSVAEMPLWHTLALRRPLLDALAGFRGLRELDMDMLCTAGLCDDDYEALAGSLGELRCLKMGTASPSIVRPWPAAGVGAVLAVLKGCRWLETLHVVFDASVVVDADVAAWGGVCNRWITRLRVGYSPIRDGAVGGIAACFKAVMPRLVEIERMDREEEWRAVQSLLESS